MDTQYEPAETRPWYGGVRRRYEFDNGYGASVIQTEFSYGHEDGLWELAVLDRGGRVTYDTPITNDVVGRLTEDEVQETLARIAVLPGGAA